MSIKIGVSDRTLKATLGGSATGATGVATAMGVVGSYGTASTGTAIATLSGASAQSATLAWFGGGSLAAGGGGAALGTCVLAVGGIGLAILAGYGIYCWASD